MAAVTMAWFRSRLHRGVISHTLDMFLNSPLKICGEVTLRIHQNLMGNNPDLGALKVVYSHQRSLAQCRGWLDRHLPQVEADTVGSNAEAARKAAESRDAGRLPDHRGRSVRSAVAGAEYRGRSRQHHAVSRDWSAVGAAVGRSTRPACCCRPATRREAFTVCWLRWPSMASA